MSSSLNLGPQYSTAPLKKDPPKGPYFRELPNIHSPKTPEHEPHPAP